MIGGVGSATLSGLAAAQNRWLQQAAYRQSMLRATRSASAASAGPVTPAQIIASHNRQSALAVLEGESSAAERAMLAAQTADGALAEISGMLCEARGIAVANASGSLLSADERAAGQVQLDAILASIDRLAGSTTFGGTRLLDGSATLEAPGAKVAIGSAATAALGEVEIDGEDFALSDLKSGGALGLAGGAGGESMMRVIDAAIGQVGRTRQSIGSFVKQDVVPQLARADVARTEMAATSTMMGDFDSAMEVLGQIRSDLLQRAGQWVSDQRADPRGMLMDVRA